MINPKNEEDLIAASKSDSPDVVALAEEVIRLRSWITSMRATKICDALAFTNHGAVIIDNSWPGEDAAWWDCLGWPDKEEIERKKTEGAEVFKVSIYRAAK